MDKKQCTEELNNQSFTAYLENGVVMIEVKSEAERTRANRAVKELNFCGSWGTRGKSNEGEYMQ
jgi:hypothetical protein